MGEMVRCRQCNVCTDANNNVCSQCGRPLAIKTCPECHTKIAVSHEFCPYCGHAFKHTWTQVEQDDSVNKMVLVGCIAIFIAIAVAIYGLFLRPNPKPEEYNGPKLEIKQPEPPRAGVPYKFAQHFVKERLVAPKTAQFEPLHRAHCVRLKDGKTWRITSFVDSQNRFGAMVRTKFTVTLTEVDGLTWRLIDLKFYE